MSGTSRRSPCNSMLRTLRGRARQVNDGRYAFGAMAAHARTRYACAPMARLGNHEDVSHSLIPLALALGLIRHKAYGDRPLTSQGRDGDFNMLAGVVASLVTLYEYASDPSQPPRVLGKRELDGGIFREGGKELRFIDGRPAKRYLAINATDVECILALLKST